MRGCLSSVAQVFLLVAITGWAYWGVMHLVYLRNDPPSTKILSVLGVVVAIVFMVWPIVSDVVLHRRNRSRNEG